MPFEFNFFSDGFMFLITKFNVEIYMIAKVLCWLEIHQIVNKQLYTSRNIARRLRGFLHCGYSFLRTCRKSLSPFGLWDSAGAKARNSGHRVCVLLSFIWCYMYVYASENRSTTSITTKSSKSIQPWNIGKNAIINLNFIINDNVPYNLYEYHLIITHNSRIDYAMHDF